MCVFVCVCVVVGGCLCVAVSVCVAGFSPKLGTQINQSGITKLQQYQNLKIYNHLLRWISVFGTV